MNCQSKERRGIQYMLNVSATGTRAHSKVVVGVPRATVHICELAPSRLS
jgi:hypothetical protein